MAAHPTIPEEFGATKEELDAYRERIAYYQSAMVQAIRMYKEGIIDRADYAKCEQVMADKNGISHISVWRRRDPEDPHSMENFKTK